MGSAIPAIFLYFVYPLFSIICSFLFVSLSLWFALWRWPQTCISRLHPVYIDLQRIVNHPRVCRAWQLMYLETGTLADEGREVHIGPLCINQMVICLLSLAGDQVSRPLLVISLKMETGIKVSCEDMSPRFTTPVNQIYL